jgi:ABC-type multidrug transport system fused ATPase/permease subunit
LQNYSEIASLFSARTRRRLWLSLVGSIAVATAEVMGVIAILPLMQLLTGVRTREGALGWLSGQMGHPSDTRLAVVISSFVFGAFAFKGLLTIAFRWWLLGFLNVQEAQTATALLRQYLAAPYWLHLQRNTASMVRTMNDAVSQAYSNVVIGSMSAITEIATIMGVCSVLVVLMPGPALAAIVYFALAGYSFQHLVRTRALAAGNGLLDSSGRTYQAAFHALGGVKEIKVRRAADHFVREYEVAREEFARAKRATAFLSELPRYVLELVFTIGVAAMTIAIFAMEGPGQAVTMLALFVAAGFRLLPSLVRLVASVSGLRVGRRGLELVLADLADLNGIGRDVERQSSLPFRRCIRLESVSFRYPSSDIAVLNGLDFEIAAGSSVGVVGSSGAGKSTFVDLLLGLHEPSSGRILVDDVDIAGSVGEWQRTIGMVPQDVYLLDDSLKSNIVFGEVDDQIDSERLAEAVELAQLHEVVRDLPEGLDTFVGERGVRLSGGQRQRIGIARALYLRPRLLVLDEATSALDNETERRISETIDSLQGRMTIVVVAHRLSTVRNCDRLVFLNHGRVEHQGTFEDVRAASPEFARLVQLGSLVEG